jgi:hypothetical protein
VKRFKLFFVFGIGGGGGGGGGGRRRKKILKKKSVEVFFSRRLCNYKMAVIRKQLQDHFIHMCLNPKP